MLLESTYDWLKLLWNDGFSTGNADDERAWEILVVIVQNAKENAEEEDVNMWRKEHSQHESSRRHSPASRDLHGCRRTKRFAEVGDVTVSGAKRLTKGVSEAMHFISRLARRLLQGRTV